MVPTRRGWPLIGTLFTTEVLLMGSGFNTIGVFFDPLMQQFHRNHAQVSFLATIVFLMMAVGGPFAGWLLEKFPARRIMVIGAIAAGLAFALASQARSYPTVILAYILLGSGMSLSTLTPVAVVIGKSFDDSERGSALGLAMSGNGAGGFLMIPVASAAVTHLGWRGGYLVLAAPMVLVAVPLFLSFVHLQPRKIDGSSVASQGEGLEAYEAIKTRALWLILSVTFLYGFGVCMPLVHLIPYLIHLGYNPERAAAAMGTVQGITCVGTIVVGGLVDRFGARSMMAACTLTCAVSLAILLGAGNVLLLVVFIVIFGFILNVMTALTPLLLAECLGMRRFALFSGVGITTTLVAGAVGPLLGGWLVDLTGEYSSAFVAALVAALCGFALTLVIPNPRFRLSQVPLHAV
jgi:MFS transporter, OFA family, oxalate/formate antiporter